MRETGIDAKGIHYRDVKDVWKSDACVGKISKKARFNPYRWGKWLGLDGTWSETGVKWLIRGMFSDLPLWLAGGQQKAAQQEIAGCFHDDRHYDYGCFKDEESV